jgi:hypothetical protein
VVRNTCEQDLNILTVSASAKGLLSGGVSHSRYPMGTESVKMENSEDRQTSLSSLGEETSYV